MKTFRQLQLEVLRYFDLASEPTTSADVLVVQNSINTSNQTRCTEDQWKFMLSSKFTLSVVAGTQEYILPHGDLDKFNYLWSTTKSRFAQSVGLEEVPYIDVAFDQSVDVATIFYELVNGGSVVKTQPTSADTIKVTTSASESGSPSLYIEGEDANGDFVSATLVKDATSSGSFAKVTYYAKTADFTGTLTLATTGGTTLLTLSPTEYGKEYPILRFRNIPLANETFTYRYFRRPRIMSRDNDRPDLPFPHSNILVFDALLDLATYNELDSESVNIWRDKQSQLLSNLYQLKLEANTVGGTGSSIKETSKNF